MAQHRRQALLHDERREHLGERRRHRLEPRPEAAEAHVRVHSEADSGQEQALADQVLALQAHRFAQAQPRLDAALLPRPAIVVDDSLDPLLAHLALGTAREDQRILDRDVDLIIEAVRHPELQLLAGQLAPVHPLVEGMQVVVAAFQHAAQPTDQHAHSSNSIASSPTTMPAASTRARSAELRHRIGFVLLMCTRTTRFASSLGSSSRLPPAPPTGRWPISRAVGASTPAAVSSSSDQKVPSNRSRSAPPPTRRTASSIAPAVGTYPSVPPVRSSVSRRPTSNA